MLKLSNVCLESSEIKNTYSAYSTMDLDDEGVLDEQVGDGGPLGHVGLASSGLGGRVLDVLEISLCPLSRSAVVFTSCVHSMARSQQGTGRQRRSCPPCASVRGKLLSTATTGFKSNTVDPKSRAAILLLRFCGRMGRQRLYLKKRPLVLH